MLAKISSLGPLYLDSRFRFPFWAQFMLKI